MAVEHHPLYPEWRAALEMVIATREARDTHRIGSRQFETADAEWLPSPSCRSCSAYKRKRPGRPERSQYSSAPQT